MNTSGKCKTTKRLIPKCVDNRHNLNPRIKLLRRSTNYISYNYKPTFHRSLYPTSQECLGALLRYCKHQHI